MSECEPPQNNYPLTDLAWQGWSCYGLTYNLTVIKTKKMGKVFNTLSFNDSTSMKAAEKIAAEFGLEIKSGSGMRVPDDLKPLEGDVLIGTFTGIGELRKTRAGDGAYKAYQFSYDSKNYFILGELHPKGTEFRFKVAKRTLEVEKKDADGNVTKEEIETFGFEYMGLVKVEEKAPIIS